jgi:FKBP-type peptidyl-prolyl cis-trans isomerase
MKEGGHAWMLMPSSLTFSDYIPRIFEVELLKIVHDPVAFENEKIKNYLDTLSQRLALNVKVAPADSTPEGIYYIETKSGTGNSPTEGDNVYVTFTLKLIDGQLIGQSTNYAFRVGDINIIQGLSVGIKKMKKGGKAILIIPYSKGFGTEGVTQQNVIIIPMYATLVYDIELKGIGSL